MTADPRPFVFVHGQHFIKGGNGLALRTRLTFEALSSRMGEKHLIAPDSPEIRKVATSSGWIFHPIQKSFFQENFVFRKIRRFWIILFSKWSDALAERMLTLMGGADVPPEPFKILIATKQNAVVWLARSDLLPLLKYTRPTNPVILDANDSVANLVSCYDLLGKVRRASGRTLASVVSQLQAVELRLASRCTRIVAISEGDLAYFEQTKVQDLVLEEACVATPPRSEQQALYDVGFLGGRHAGSIASAKNLLRIAARDELRHKKFAIAGQVCASLSDAAHPANVSLLGEIETAAGFFRSCRQIVLWANQETGTSVKFQEAILSGATVLSNSVAARWSKAIPGRDFVLCETEDDVAKNILEGEFVQGGGLQSENTPVLIGRRFIRLAEV